MCVEVHILRMSYGACSARLCDLCMCSGMPCRRVGLHLGCKQPSREFCNSKLFVAGGTIIIITCAVAHPRETTSKANAGCHVCTLHDTYPAVRHHDTNGRSHRSGGAHQGGMVADSARHATQGRSRTLGVLDGSSREAGKRGEPSARSASIGFDSRSAVQYSSHSPRYTHARTPYCALAPTVLLQGYAGSD